MDVADVLSGCLPQNLSGRGRAAVSSSGAMCCPELEEREDAGQENVFSRPCLSLIADDDPDADAPSSDARGS